MKLKATNTSLPFSVSSDEKSILFGSRSSDGEKVYIVVPSNNNQRLIESGDYPTWSPDGSKIAFTVDGRIHTMNADGSNSSMLVAMAGNSFLSWSPGGDKIAYVSHNSGYGDVYVTTLDGMQTRLSYSSNYDGYIAWSGDGSKLAYITAYSLSYAGLFGDVVVVDFSDNTTRQITSVVGATSASPSWSPDGQWLTFGACKTGQSRPNCAIFIVKSDGTELQQVKDYEQYETQPVWRP